MARPFYEQAAQAWIETVIQQVDPAAVAVFVDQVVDGEGPRPPFPYATLEVLTNTARGNGTPELTQTDTAIPASTRYESIMAEHRLASLAIMVYGDSAMAMARRLRHSLWNDSDIDLQLRAAGVTVLGPIAGPTKVPVQRQTEREYPVSVDYRIAWRETTTGETDVIETVEATNNITP